jgi:hypothetical protein
MHLASPLSLPQHPDQHGSERPILLAVDQQLCKGAALRVALELSDPVGPVESWAASGRGAARRGERDQGCPGVPVVGSRVRQGGRLRRLLRRHVGRSRGHPGVGGTRWDCAGSQVPFTYADTHSKRRNETA